MVTADRCGVLGTGRAVPADRITNRDLERLVDTSDDWIVTRTGIRERRRAATGEATSTLAARAATEALERAGVGADALDLVICATVTPDQILPSTACLVQAQIGADRAAAFDLAAACSGFLYGLTLADGLIRSGGARYALVIGAEVLTRFVNYADRETCILFGDGAGAAVLGPVAKDRGILASRIRSDGRQACQLSAPGGGSRMPPSGEQDYPELCTFRMEGQELFRQAVLHMSSVSAEVLACAGLGVDDVDLFIPHQANQRITDGVASWLRLDRARLYSNIARYGNTAAASVPIALDECVQSGRVQPGSVVLLAAFGGGTTWGATLLRW
jgi:3-oxoacyl-[acyl-carrier-protein] synthase-3